MASAPCEPSSVATGRLLMSRQRGQRDQSLGPVDVALAVTGASTPQVPSSRRYILSVLYTSISIVRWLGRGRAGWGCRV